MHLYLETHKTQERFTKIFFIMEVQFLIIRLEFNNAPFILYLPE